MVDDYWDDWHEVWSDRLTSELRRIANSQPGLHAYLDAHLDAIEAALAEGDLDQARIRQAQAFEQIRAALEQRRELVSQPQGREELMRLKRSIDHILNELLLHESRAGEAERLSAESARAVRAGDAEALQRLLAEAVKLAPE
jgi:hypothetical protein